jgi:DNA-binding GntR family transcriptional regulator
MEKDFEEIKSHPSLKDMVYENLKLQIITGKLEPNRHLLEAELSEMMKISRAPIREALTILEKEGFVTIIPRKGAKVASISKEEVESIWEIRSVLESYAARNAAQKCKENELNKIENKLNHKLEEPFDFSGYMRLDLELHELIYKHLDNKMLKEIIVLVRQNSLRILNFAEGQSALTKDIVFADLHEHLQIVEALKARDPERAAATVFIHIENSKHRIIKALEKKD